MQVLVMIEGIVRNVGYNKKAFKSVLTAFTMCPEKQPAVF